MMRLPRAFAVFLLAAWLSPVTAAESQPRIAIIIDDLGNGVASGERAVALPGPVACAILPGTPGAERIAAAARASGKEVLVHLPMQAAMDVAVEHGSITLDMTRRAFEQAFADALAAVPGAVGVNNHRGSLVTRHPGHMLWLMQEIRASGSLFFVDSYTTHRSVALRIAAESGVAAVKRDVFLDTDRAPETVEREFERLKAIARLRGAAVAIGHPYEHTLALLERELPRLASEGFELVPISALALER